MLITFDIGGTSIKYGILTLRKGQLVFVMQDEVSSDARVLKGPGQERPQPRRTADSARPRNSQTPRQAEWA